MEDETPESEDIEYEDPDMPMETPLATPSQSPTKKVRIVKVAGSDDEQSTRHSTPSQAPDSKKIKDKSMWLNINIVFAVLICVSLSFRPVNTLNKKGKTPANKPASNDNTEGSETDDDKHVKEADSDSDESVAEAMDDLITFNTNIQPLDQSVAASWNS
ncbi:hypothetical protein FS837_005374 [Tulasnella sp. UAMH 9824]|nr:hypothetical protein FS837_005374 [Tulasnella sp. UAMH 9824]